MESVLGEQYPRLPTLPPPALLGGCFFLRGPLIDLHLIPSHNNVVKYENARGGRIMKRFTGIILLTLIFCLPMVSATGIWPVYSQPDVTTPQAAPGNTGSGSLSIDTIIPNLTVIDPLSLPESWTIECIDSPDIKFSVFSSLHGQVGVFFNNQGGRTDMGRLVLMPDASGAIIDGSPDIGDQFTFNLTALSQSPLGAPDKLFGDPEVSGAALIWNGALDIRVPGSGTVPCQVYPVRDGIVVNVEHNSSSSTGSYVAIEPAPGGDGIYDIYRNIGDITVSIGDTVVSWGEDATCIAGAVTSFGADYRPHLKFQVLDGPELNQVPAPLVVRNPLNGIIPLEDHSKPVAQGAYLIPNDALKAYHSPLDYGQGEVDIVASIIDDNSNGTMEPCGIHRVAWSLYQGTQPESLEILNGVLMDDDIFRGHLGCSEEYTPDNFDLYSGSMSSVTTDYVFAPDTALHRPHYILTNNEQGNKYDFWKEHHWDTQQEVTCPTGYTSRYPDGPYTVLIQSADIAGNLSDDQLADNRQRVTVLNNYDRIIYVDDDSSVGNGSLQSPYRTISQAMAAAVENSSTLIFVMPGTYGSGEAFPIHFKSGITLRGEDQRTTIVAGSGGTPMFTMTGTGPGTILEGFTLQNAGHYHGAVEVHSFGYAIIQHCRFRDNMDSGIYVSWSNNIDINNNIFENNGTCGVHLYHCNTTFLGREAERATVKIHNSTFVDNMTTAVFADLSSWFNLYNSIIMGHNYGVTLDQNSHGTIDYCNMYNNGISYRIMDWLSSINYVFYLASNPAFHSTPSGDYYLGTVSPCINNGGTYHQNNPQVFLKTTRADNMILSDDLYDDDDLDIGFHYNPLSYPLGPPATPTPQPTSVPTETPVPTATPTTIPMGTGRILLDAPFYYGESDLAEILVTDSDLNTDPGMAETYEITVISDTDPTGIPITITEIGTDSPVFSSSDLKSNMTFSTAVSIPYSTLLVSHGDTITAIYNDLSPAGTRQADARWYAALPTNTPAPTQTPTAAFPTATPFAGAYFETFEYGVSEWTLSGLWHSTTLDSYSPNTSLWYGQEHSGNYDTGTINSGSAISPLIHINPGDYLTFNSREDTEGQGTEFDTRKVYISVDAGVTWTCISQSSNNADNWYQYRSIDLTDYADRDVQLKFEFDTVDGMSNTYAGWFIDDIAIGDFPPALPVPSTGPVGIALMMLVFGVSLYLFPTGRNQP